jgi:hypothetical protein
MMGMPPDENLPEVVPDSSPQALTYAETYERRWAENGDPKYAVVYDSMTPKILTEPSPLDPYSATVFGSSPGVNSPQPTQDPWSTEKSLANEDGNPPAPEEPPRIYGMKRRTFWIVLVVVAIVLAVAVGGGVGGAMASKKRASEKLESNAGSDGENNSDGSSNKPTPSASSTPSSTSSTSSASATPTFLNNDTTIQRDFAWQGFTGLSYQGDATGVYRAVGFYDMPELIRSYVWLPGQEPGCCATLCANKTKEGAVGWRCTEFHQEKASTAFRRIYLACGADAEEKNSRCI